MNGENRRNGYKKRITINGEGNSGQLTVPIIPDRAQFDADIVALGCRLDVIRLRDRDNKARREYAVALANIR